MMRRRETSEAASSASAPPLTSPPPSLLGNTVKTTEDGNKEGGVLSSSTSTKTKSPIALLTPPMKAKMSGFKINDINFTQCQSADDPITIVINDQCLLICIEKLSIEFSIPFDHINDMTITGKSKTYGESLVIDLRQAPDIALMRTCEFSPSGLNSQLSIFKELLEVSTWPGTMQIHNVRNQGDEYNSLLHKLQTELSTYSSLSHMNIFQSKEASPPLFVNSNSKSANASKGHGLSVLKKKGPLRILTPTIKEDGTTSGEGSPVSEEEVINVEDFLDTLSSPELANYETKVSKASTTSPHTDEKSVSTEFGSSSMDEIEIIGNSTMNEQVVVKITDPSPLRPGRLSFEGTPQSVMTSSSSSSSSSSPAVSTTSEIEDLKIYLLQQREIETKERELIKCELAKEKFRSRMIIGTLGIGLGFTGLLLVKPEMQKTIRQSLKAAFKDLLLSKPALVTKVAISEAFDLALQTLENMNIAANSTALAVNDLVVEFTDAVKKVWEIRSAQDVLKNVW